MSLSPPKVEKPRPGGRSAWGPSTDPVVDPVGVPGPPLLLLPAQLAIDPESLAAVAAQVKAAIAEAVREGVAEGFATAWPEDQQQPVQPQTPAG